MTYVITRSCCNDATCVTVCPVNCIHPTPDEPDYATAEMLYIDPDTCIDCGACVDVCPVEAITPDFDLTENAERYLDINARYFRDPAHQGYPETQYQKRKPAVEVSEPEPLRIAIVGSGPAACYAAEELLSRKGLQAEVHMFERLPTPWGLVRHGVAPDHQDTKEITRQFTGTARRKNLDLHLNVDIGEHLSHDELLTHHHAVLYAVGAATDRSLGVPGEELPGSHSATEFVAWYNGHPDFADRTFDLSGERAVIVGNGNVALDVARILASDVDRLARTDIADHALEALASSNISEVLVLGRRGPAQAAFTTPELLGLADTDDFDVVVDPADAALDPVSAAALSPHDIGVFKTEVLAELARQPSGRGDKRVELRFLTSPVEILGDDRVRGIRVVRNALADSSGRLVAQPTGDVTELNCGLVLRSIGYRGRPLPGLPFDADKGTLPNNRGRVVDPATGDPLAGVYAAGWIKRGPSGVIGTNKKCAEDTVQALLDDYEAGRLKSPEHDAEALRTLLTERRPEALDYAAWESIDRHEKKTAKPQRRPRVKLTSSTDLLAVAAGDRETTR
ncbi:FAD-dependent oxidoreductase [Saccharopolyspora pogona]|uniref:FAD-dependent oxidoreductase n=1 Tax=Saccharopolyspora pogona TaxID=333966 RepID=UPI001688D2D5|nr:FAD-dependent oxidoreductase [Saccharopolyspora pogona]